MPPTRTRPPQLIIASHNHGAGLELLQLAERRGYTVRRAHTGAQAIEQAHAAPPDMLVLDESLTDMEVFAASRALSIAKLRAASIRFVSISFTGVAILHLRTGCRVYATEANLSRDGAVYSPCQWTPTPRCSC